jgi:hypothetical protein
MNPFRSVLPAVLALFSALALASWACGRSEAPAAKSSAPAPAATAAPAAGPGVASPETPAAPGQARAPAAHRETFGTKPCGRLLAIEEVEGAFATTVPMINIVEEGTCDYEDQDGHPVVSVRITTGSGLRCTLPDGTYMGSPTEKIEGTGEQGVWSASAGSACFVLGKERVQISLGSQPPEGKTSMGVAADLARKAYSRVPKG